MRKITGYRSLKIVLRCRDFAASFDFYTRILGLAVVDQWQEKDSTGCILALPGDRREALLEISQIKEQSRRYKPTYSEPFQDSKIDLQLRTTSLDDWTAKLEGAWPYDGPKTLPWGGRWIKFYDPDHLQIAIYEGST